MTILNLFAVLIWPLIISAAAWALAVYALNQPNDMTRTVDSLIRPSGAKQSDSPRK